MGLLIGNVRDSANHDKWHLKVVANVRNCGRFHLNGNRLREVMLNFSQPHGTINECIAADDKSANSVQIELGDARFCGCNQRRIGFKTSRATR